MVYFLHGPDTYRSREKLREIVFAFVKKADGALGVTRIDAEDDPEPLLSAGRTPSLFSRKELLVIERPTAAPAMVTASLEGRLAGWAEDPECTVVFWEEDTGKEPHPLVTVILQHAAKSQEFKFLAPGAVRRWLDAESAKRSLRLSPPEKDALVAAAGSDLWAIANELEKLAAGWPPAFEKEEEEKIWNFTDAFLVRRREALGPLGTLLQAGHEAMYLLAALAGAVRTLALIRWGIMSGKLKKAVSGLHPFVVRKNTELAKRTNEAAIARLFHELLKTDAALKTGVLPPQLSLIKLVLKR